MIRSFIAGVAGLLLAPVAFGQPFLNVPAIYTQSPRVFQDIFARSRCGTVRVVLFGDSQEYCPGGQGALYIPRLQFEFWSRIGNTPETPWMTIGMNYGGGLPYADWLSRGTNLPAGLTQTRIWAARIPPGFQPRKTSTTDGANVNGNQLYGNLLMLQHDGASLDPLTGLAGAATYFDRNAPIYLDVMAATHFSSGEIHVRVTPAPGPATGFYFPDTAAFDSAIGLESNMPDMRVFRCGPLPMGTGAYMQVELSGTDPTKFTDLMSARFVNSADPRGWAISVVSGEGYTARHMPVWHSQCGETIALMEPDVAFICQSANDGNWRTAAEYQGDLFALIAFIRAGTREDLPIVLISDPARVGLNPEMQAEYDLHPTSQYNVALMDPLVCALNSRRLTHEQGWTTEAAGTYTTDGAHYTAAGAEMKARVEAQALFGAFFGAPADCNENSVDDGCDIAAGTSLDANGDRVPDECGCDPDFNCDGSSDQDDVVCLIGVVAGEPGCECADADFNGDGNVDQDDVAAMINAVAGGGCP